MPLPPLAEGETEAEREAAVRLAAQHGIRLTSDAGAPLPPGFDPETSAMVPGDYPDEFLVLPPEEEGRPHGWHPRHLARLFSLYLVQGLPFGFQTKSLPVLLRRRNVSLTSISFASALSLPWLLKPLLAPFVDSYWSPTVGRRRSWILPTQLLLALAMLAAAVAASGESLALVLGCVLAMNLAASTQDIAVDGLAVDTLSEEELSYGNSAQVVGFKAGMLLGGGILVWAAEQLALSWSATFLAMAAVVLAVWASLLSYREPRPSGPSKAGNGEPTTVREVIRLLLAIVRRPHEQRVLCLVATYKLGEVMGDVMFKPFLVDMGFDNGQIGLWTGLYAMVCSILGSLAGSWLADRLPLLNAISVSFLLRFVAQVFRFMLAIQPGQIKPSAAAVVRVACFEAFVGGVLTTCMFTWMMAESDRRVGASHYTLLSSVEIIGKSAGAFASGFLADRFGYRVVFATASMISLFSGVFLVPLYNEPPPYTVIKTT